MMANEIKVFIDAVRNGKTLQQASAAYCSATLSLPIRLADYRNAADAENAAKVPSCIEEMTCFALAFDCARRGGSNDEIIAAFQAGIMVDVRRDYGWRPMVKNER